MFTVIIDSNNLCYIQLHAFGTDLSHGDQQTGVMWGFLRQIGLLAERFETNRFVFAWDSRASFRHVYYPEYKANRSRFRPDDDEHEKEEIDFSIVFKQFDLLREKVLPLMGFRNSFRFVGREADDIIASTVLNHEGKEPPIVVSTDKDLYQLLDRCSIWKPINREMFLIDDFVAKYGVQPSEWVQVRAMTGDVSDNIKGIPGIGETTAIKFVNNELKLANKKRKDILSESGQGIIERNTKMMRLPYPGTPNIHPDFSKEIFSLDNFFKICDRYAFQSFTDSKELPKWRKRFSMVD